MSRYSQNYNDFYNDDKNSGYCASCNPCPPRPCPPRPHHCCCVGPTGPRGPVGATILGSYETYAAFIAAHPTGNPGDAYLVGGELYVWNEGTGWQNMGSLIGPTGATGATGAAGATILDSYATYAEFIAAHPRGTQGDAYLVGGELYVWNVETGMWKNMGSLIGPTGATGAAGATILGSYDTLADLQAAHPTGTAGDAYLVGGELYVWNADTGMWQNMGNLIGPTGATGATGAAGATILDSYATLADLVAEHPTGTAGDAYLVGGELYVWNAETGMWQNMGSLIGPTGATGATGAAGATILDSYATLADLVAEHPTGTAGDAYLVGGELYVWNAETGMWQNMGSLIGPTGATGATGSVGTILGSYNTLTELQNAHPTGNQGDAYLVDGVLYVWDTETNSWQPVGNLRGPATESRTIVPFASVVAPLTHSLNGLPTRVSLLGFGYGDTRGNLTSADDYSIVLDTSDGHFDLDADDSRDNFQLVFSLPFDMAIKSIVLTCGTWGAREFTSTVYPYIQLYAAEPTSNSFRVINGAVAIPETGVGPGEFPRGTMRFALTQDLDIKLSAGTRIAIGGLMRTTVATGTIGEETYWMYFTGAVGLAYDPEA